VINVLLVVCGVLFGICALLMIVAILLQESKGGGLAALGGTRAESAFGASNPLRKMTVVLSILFFILASGLYLALRPKAYNPAAEKSKKAAPENPAPGGVEEVIPVPGPETPAPPKAPATEPGKETPKETTKPVTEKPPADPKTASDPAPAPAPKPEAGK
jgi:protein translocase SecG subunit